VGAERKKRCEHGAAFESLRGLTARPRIAAMRSVLWSRRNTAANSQRRMTRATETTWCAQFRSHIAVGEKRCGIGVSGIGVS
jgi:hypothetical protein